MHITKKSLEAAHCRRSDMDDFYEAFPLETVPDLQVSIEAIHDVLGMRMALVALKAVSGHSAELMALKIDIISIVRENLVTPESREAFDLLESFFIRKGDHLDVDVVLSLALAGYMKVTTLHTASRSNRRYKDYTGNQFREYNRNVLAAEALVKIFKRSVISVYGRIETSAEADQRNSYLATAVEYKLRALYQSKSYRKKET